MTTECKINTEEEKKNLLKVGVPVQMIGFSSNKIVTPKYIGDRVIVYEEQGLGENWSAIRNYEFKPVPNIFNKNEEKKRKWKRQMKKISSRLGIRYGTNIGIMVYIWK